MSCALRISVPLGCTRFCNERVCVSGGVSVLQVRRHNVQHDQSMSTNKHHSPPTHTARSIHGQSALTITYKRNGGAGLQSESPRCAPKRHKRAQFASRTDRRASLSSSADCKEELKVSCKLRLVDVRSSSHSKPPMGVPHHSSLRFC